MTVQLNLLPDVKLEYIKAQRMKRMVVGVSVLGASLTLASFIILFLIVNVVQKNHIANLDADIEQGVSEIQAIPDIDKVLTIQNQLNALTPLHEATPQTSRFINYLAQLTPDQASIETAQLDMDETVIELSGEADKLETVNKFADTLKFTTYKTKGADVSDNAFSEVVLEGFSVEDKRVTYQMSLKFDPEIFNNTEQIELKVPDIISTRSQTEKPSGLFQESENTDGGGE